MVCSRLCFNTPIPLEVFAWGSISTSNTLRPAAARYVARLMAVVVLPTPPFWLAIAYTFDTGCYRTFPLHARLDKLSIMLHRHCNKCPGEKQVSSSTYTIVFPSLSPPPHSTSLSSIPD